MTNPEAPRAPLPAPSQARSGLFRPAAALAAAVWLPAFAAAPAVAQDEPAPPARGADRATLDPNADPAADAAADPEAGPKTGPPLPARLQPPPKKPESMLSVKPLLSETELKDLENALTRARYRDALEAGPTDAKNEQIVRDWAKWRVAGLTRPELIDDRPALDAAVTDLLREANRSVGGRSNARDAERIKLQVFPLLAAELEQLKDNHLVLRSQAVKVLDRLEVAGGGGAPVRRFGPGLKALLAIFEGTGDAEPELGVKYQTARALVNVARNGRNVPGDQEQKAVNLFADTLVAHPEYPGWMQGVLAESVAGMQLRGGGLADKLMTVLTDTSRPFEARAQAAKAVVRLPGAAGEVRDALPGALENLGAAMATAFNANRSAEFREDFITLEFAFKPVAPSEVGQLDGAILTNTNVPGFLQAAYNRVHPLVKHVAGQNLRASPSTWEPIPADLLTAAGAAPAAG